MNDNEIISKLQSDVFAVLNQSPMPVMVKSLIVENALLKLNAELAREREEALKASQEINLHVDELNLTTDTEEVDSKDIVEAVEVKDNAE